MKNKDDKQIDSIKEQMEELQGDIEFLYSLIQPEELDTSIEDEKTTVEISEDLYKILYEYCENKKFIFMGVS